MLRSFADEETETIWQGDRSRKLPPEIHEVARRKLRMLNNAQDLRDLRSPPGNRLEALTAGRRGQYSIRVNQKWRVCFRWRGGDAYEVEIVDYHGE